MEAASNIQKERNQAVAILKNAAEESQLVVNDASRYTRINSGHLKRVVAGQASLTKIETILIEGFLRRRGLLPPLDVKPGDVVLATKKILSEMKITLDGCAELYGLSPRTIEDWFFKGLRPYGLSKLHIESVLWERGWANPEYPSLLTEELLRLWWGLYKQCFTLEEAADAASVIAPTIVRWLSSRMNLPSGKALEGLRKWLAAKQLPAMPEIKAPGELPKEISEDANDPRAPAGKIDFLGAISVILSEGKSLLSGPPEPREKIRDRHMERIFEASNILNGLCSEDARDELGYGEQGRKRR